jgi:hypothetical protein
MPTMKDADLRELVAKRRDASFKHVDGQLARDRRLALQYYRGDNLSDYGDSGDGLSTVVSRDTMESVESVLPALIKPFVAGDETVRFEPIGPEDEEPAKQATEYVNYLFNNHNDAFRVVHDSLKDGLMFRYGAAKVVVEEIEDVSSTRYQGLDETGLAAVDADPDTEIDGPIEQDQATGLFAVRVKRTTKDKRYRVIVVPPERFLFEARIADLSEATFLAHHDEKPVGDLIAMGLDKVKCQQLQPGRPVSMEDDERNRYDSEIEELSSDDLARRVWVDECYIRCDYAGDGALSWRRVIIGGNDNIVLLDEEADDHPFVGWTPIPEPHKLVGWSYHDLTKDIQQQKTALKREGLNALYLANRPMREVVEGQVNIDDVLSPSVGGLVRVKQKGMVSPLPSGGDGVMQQSLAMIEALDSERESRTGVTRYNQGIDANSLNKTATGVSIISNASMQRQELVARQYAESFLKPVFGKMLKLVSKHQDKAQVIRLRGQWVEMDPTQWKTGYDMTVSVGLGTGNKDQQIAHLQALSGVMAQIAQAQDGLSGPVVKWDNIYEVAKRFPEAMGFKGSEKFFHDPAAEQEQPQAELGADNQAEQEQQMQQQTAAVEAQQHEAELAQKHATAVAVARIDAESREEVAKINAEKDIIIAGLQVPPELTADPEPAQEGGEMVGDKPSPPAPPVDPEVLAGVMGEFEQ